VTGTSAAAANLGQMGTNRLESFSDGVIAVAITLLVLALGVPAAHGGQSLGDALGHRWPQYAAYAVSFFSIGIIWINHHAMTGRLREADHTILMLNLLLLMTIVILPFATNLLADYLRRPEGHTTAAVVFCGCYLTMAVMFSILQGHILLRKSHLLEPPLSQTQRVRILRQATVGLIPYAVATGVAFFSPYTALGICAALVLVYATPLTTGATRTPRSLSDE
jgi:uncharacterized membrane protein